MRRLRHALASDVSEAFCDTLAAKEFVAIDGTVKQAEHLLFLAEKRFEMEVKAQLDVQDAELNVLVARANVTRAQRDWRVARINLSCVMGVL